MSPTITPLSPEEVLFLSLHCIHMPHLHARVVVPEIFRLYRDIAGALREAEQEVEACQQEMAQQQEELSSLRMRKAEADEVSSSQKQALTDRPFRRQRFWGSFIHSISNACDTWTLSRCPV